MFPPEEFPSQVSHAPYISFGWGDRAYYTEVESWDDLNLKTALRAACLPTVSAMHVQYLLTKPDPGETTIPLQLTEAQIKFLVHYILSSVQKNGEGQGILIPGVSRYKTDRFYEAYGTYHMFNTSNNWTNRALKKMGIRSPVWAPFENSIRWHLNKVYEYEI